MSDFERRRADFDRMFEQARRKNALFTSAILGVIVGVAVYFAAKEQAIPLIVGPWSAGLIGAAVGITLSLISRIFRR